MYILPIYAALLVLLFVVLSIRTLRLRRSLKIGVGDGGNPQMLRAMRVHWIASHARSRRAGRFRPGCGRFRGGGR